jgi:hypothetical protein
VQERAGPASAPKDNDSSLAPSTSEAVSHRGADIDSGPERPKQLEGEKSPAASDEYLYPTNKAQGKAGGVPARSEPIKHADDTKRIEADVIKAIQNRAIAGVRVSVIDGTAYLDGRVASVRQKLMAERAARSVAEVKSVRNRLSVGPY